MIEQKIRLLKKQREKGLTGFTIPYLIGSCRSPIGEIYDDEQRDYNEFIDLLTSFQSLSGVSNTYICISECIKLKQPVVALYNSSDQALEYGDEILGFNGAASTLFTSSQYHLNQNINSVTDKLWELSKGSIFHGKFSFENGEYTAFTASDIKSIEATREIA